MTNDWKEEFNKKCCESFAKDGFLTTDLIGDWALDKTPIESFISKTRDQAYQEGILAERTRLRGEVENYFKSVSSVTIDGLCKYWNGVALGYSENDTDFTTDKFFPNQIKNSVLTLLADKE